MWRLHVAPTSHALEGFKDRRDVRTWEPFALPRGVRPPVPPPHPWVGDVLAAVGWAASWGEMPTLPPVAEHTARRVGLDHARSTVIIMADGLGTHALGQRLAHAPTLRRIGTEMVVAQTCSPSTTAAALTTFATGALPAETRMVGYSVRHGDGVMNLLKFAEDVESLTWQPVPTFFEKFSRQGVGSVVITDPRFRHSGLTSAAMRGARFVPATQLSERFEAAIREIRVGTPIIYVYWAGIDATGHHYGPNSREWAEALEDFDAALGHFLRRAEGNAQVLLTADHGMVEVEERVDIAFIPELSEDVEVLAGEGRAVHVHIRPGKARETIRRWCRYWEGNAWIAAGREIARVIGVGPGLELVGDMMVFPKGRTVIVDSRTQSAASIALKGVHGSLTPEEMEIPFWRLI